jgi:hypothetical protein
MLPLDDQRWKTLSHAYGPATDIPALLGRAAHDMRPGHKPGSTWFDLWSALCHQGDTYTASYAAAPHLIALAPAHLQHNRYDPLFLTACIELARLEGRGPAIPEDLGDGYRAAIEHGRALASAYVSRAWDHDASVAIEASAAAMAGDKQRARELLDGDDGPS